jgi:hypothetical protein
MSGMCKRMDRPWVSNPFYTYLKLSAKFQITLCGAAS